MVFIIVTRKISKMVMLFVKYIIIEGGRLTVKKKKKKTVDTAKRGN